MKHAERIWFAVLIAVVDFLVPVIPILAIYVAYVIIKRPPGVKAWIDRVYAGE